jgi:tRNA threonylcarbamoyladenosine biosynthesis protein TsaE
MTIKGQAVFTIRNEQETALLAERIAKLIKPGAVLALDGDLGAGKTTFSQKFAKAIGVNDVVNSPTFTIIKEYEGASMPFYHMDVYRLSLEEAYDLGLDDYFYGSGVTIVEWARLIEELLPPERLEMYIAHEGGEERNIRITGIGEPYASWCGALDEMGAGNNDDRA